ncbi:MAG: mannitol dehydrogenase family protein [Aestuariivirga sp.]
MANRILQFGTSRFLQAHADFFVHQARIAGQDVGPITVVKTTVGGAREGRVAALSNPAGFPVRLRGYRSGQLIDETTQVTSVNRALDANTQWPEIKKIFAGETEIVISNVGEAGYELSGDDEKISAFDQTAPKSFPLKLAALLVYRFKTSGKPLLVLPCELASQNGQKLRQLVLNLTKDVPEGEGFKTWLTKSVTFCDTLVDRIVSEAIEPIGAIGEPYGLWAIERSPGLIEPLQHPCIVYTDDLEPYLRLKLHILNLGHTFLAEIWQTENRPKDETVRELLKDQSVKSRLMALYNDEILPGFAAHNMVAAATDYVKTTVERFENPFLNHRLSDIAQNHAQKIERRMVDFITWTRGKNPALNFILLRRVVEKNGTQAA